MKKRIFAALLALCLTALTGCDWSTADPEDIFGTLTDYYNVEQKKQDVKLTSFALPYLKGETADPITCSDGAMQTLGPWCMRGCSPWTGNLRPSPPWRSPIPTTPPGIPTPSPCEAASPSATAVPLPPRTW